MTDRKHESGESGYRVYVNSEPVVKNEGTMHYREGVKCALTHTHTDTHAHTDAHTSTNVHACVHIHMSTPLACAHHIHIPEHNVAVCCNVFPSILCENSIGLWGHPKLLLTRFSESFQVPLHTSEMGVEIGWQVTISAETLTILHRGS